MKSKQFDRIDEMAFTQQATVAQISSLLRETQPEVIAYLMRKAVSVKESFYHNQIFIRAIIEFSNICRCQCGYCGINSNNKKLSRYRMNREEILTLCCAAIDAGYRTIVLQSGEDLYYTQEMIGEIIAAIKNYDKTVAVTLSLGERSREVYAFWREKGADRYLIKHETSDPDLYKQLHPRQNLEERLSCQRDLRELGYELGGGFMVGLPGQTIESLAQDILLLQEMQVAMAGIGPFIPHPDTPLRDCMKGEVAMTQRVLAIARLLLPKVHLPATTALTVQGGRTEALHCGADVIMQKATPEEKQHLYAIYPRTVREEYSLREKREILLGQLAALGYQGV